jgi:hypothetical protein
MLKIPLATWIANAAVGLTGLYGEAKSQQLSVIRNVIRWQIPATPGHSLNLLRGRR